MKTPPQLFDVLIDYNNYVQIMDVPICCLNPALPEWTGRQRSAAYKLKQVCPYQSCLSFLSKYEGELRIVQLALIMLKSENVASVHTASTRAPPVHTSSSDEGEGIVEKTRTMF